MNNNIFEILLISLRKLAEASAIYYKYIQTRKILRFITVQRSDLVTIFLLDTRLAYLHRCVNLLKLDEEYPEENKLMKVADK